MIVKNIHTPLELIKALKAVNSEFGYFEVLQRMDISDEEFEKYYTWSDKKYTRNCLARTDDFELMLICWEQDQASRIHDYGDAMAWVHPISGCLKEERYLLSNNGNGLIKISSLTLEDGEFSFVNKTGIHQYQNNYESRAVSLHLYVKPLRERKIYDCSEGMCKTWSAEIVDDSVCVVI